jgi:hypothetical protein
MNRTARKGDDRAGGAHDAAAELGGLPAVGVLRDGVGGERRLQGGEVPERHERRLAPGSGKAVPESVAGGGDDSQAISAVVHERSADGVVRRALPAAGQGRDNPRRHAPHIDRDRLLFDQARHGKIEID